MTQITFTALSEGACAGMPIDLFFPTPEQRDYVSAKKVCNSCQIRNDCLKYALDHDNNREHGTLPLAGIWGGLTTGERKKLLDPKTPKDPDLRQRRTYTTTNRNKKI